MLAIKSGKRRLTLEKKQSTSVRIRSYSGPYSVHFILLFPFFKLSNILQQLQQNTEKH